MGPGVAVGTGRAGPRRCGRPVRGPLELNALVQVLNVTDDADPVIGAVCSKVEGLTPGHAAKIPYILVGSTGEIVDKMFAAREQWSISYFVVRGLEAFAPVIEAARRAE